MKEIKAYIKSERLSQVVAELHKLEGLTGLSISELKGFGRGREENAPVRIVENMIHYIPHVKLEIICQDKLVDSIIEAIQKGAHTGLRGDGKIYIAPIEDALRISTHERGEGAV